VKCDELADLLEKMKFDYLIASDWREIHFVKFDQRDSSRLSISDRGRAFGEKAELRWRRSEDGEHFICRWLSDDGASLGAGWKPLPEEELNRLKAEKIQYLLWGEPLFDGSEWLAEDDVPIWYQARIPKKLKYPIEEDLAARWEDSNDKTPLVLHVREYKQNGQTMFERFIGLKKYEPK